MSVASFAGGSTMIDSRPASCVMLLLLFCAFAVSTAKAQTPGTMTMTAPPQTMTMTAPPSPEFAAFGGYHWIDCSGGADMGVWGVCLESRFVQDTMTMLFAATSLIGLAWIFGRMRKV